MLKVSNRKYYFLISLLFSFALHAQDFDYQYHVDWLGYYTFKKLPEPNYAQQRTNSLSNDFRLDLKLSKHSWQLALRPRAVVGFLADSHLEHTDSKVYSFFNEAFIVKQVSDEVEVSAGRLSYQWGPAELASWSNSLFHFNYDYRSFFYLEKGKYLLKGSYSPTKNFSMVVLGEMLNEHMETDYEESILQQKYRQKALIKAELIFDKASDYLGVTLASGEIESKHLGLYGAYGVNEAFSLYTDSRLSLANTYYDLTNIGAFKSWKLVNEDYSEVKPLVALGARYESNYDLRFEYIYNSLGFDHLELKSALGSTESANPFAATNLLILSKSGRELLGQQYFYTSLRIPDLGVSENMTLFLRHFLSLQDHSFTVQANVEKELTDSLVGYIETDTAFGKKRSELRLLNQFIGRIGGRWTF